MDDETTAVPGAGVAGPAGGPGVIEVDPQTDPRWQDFVADHPDATVYHHPAWLQVLGREYRQDGVHLACVDGAGRFRGVLPMILTRGVPGGLGGAVAGRRLASLPRTPVAGPLADGRGAAAALVAEAAAYARRRPGVRLQLKMGGPDLDGLVPGVEGVPWRAAYALRLPEAPAAVRFGDSRNHTRIKSSVAKSAKLGVAVRLAEHTDDLRRWYELYLVTMRTHLVPARPYRLFAAMWELLRPRGLMRLMVAEAPVQGETRMLAGSILLMFGGTVFYAFNGRDPAMLHMRSNDALQWRAIHDAAAEGYRTYDLGEVAGTNEGLAGFKRKWAAEARTLYRYHCPPVAADGVADPSAARGRAGALAGALWQRVPVRVTAAVGDQVYRFL